MTELETLEFMMVVSLWCKKKGVAPDDAIISLLRQMNKRTGVPGFIDHYVDGKPLNPDDGGMAAVRLEKRADGNVYLVLGQMVANWFALTPELAKVLAEKLVEVADGPCDETLASGQAPV